MIRARATRKFNYMIVNPVYLVQCNLAPMREDRTVKARDILEFETESEFQELRDIARENKSDLIKL